MIVVCENCNKEFERSLYEKNRSKHCFCSKACYNAWQTHEAQEFKEHARDVRRRSRQKKWKTDLTRERLRDIFVGQDGKCPYTGKNLLLIRQDNPYQASLDRKESSKPYVTDNVEFVSLIAQYAKNTFTREQVIQFCKDVAEYHNDL